MVASASKKSTHTREIKMTLIWQFLKNLSIINSYSHNIVSYQWHFDCFTSVLMTSLRIKTFRYVSKIKLRYNVYLYVLFHSHLYSTQYTKSCQQLVFIILPFSSFFAISLSLFLNSEEFIISDAFHLVEEVTFSII